MPFPQPNLLMADGPTQVVKRCLPVCLETLGMPCIRGHTKNSSGVNAHTAVPCVSQKCVFISDLIQLPLAVTASPLLMGKTIEIIDSPNLASVFLHRIIFLIGTGMKFLQMELIS